MIDNRQARRMMERMGLNMKQVEDVKEVVIITGSKEMRLPQAQVFEINAKGMRVFQVSSSTVEEKEVEMAAVTLTVMTMLLLGLFVVGPLIARL
ncbi:MAG: hypothetical protein JRN29_05690 [Nitrososphaerota archaeon]|nr:hypothetical protein [Nitrososphaerota archaeon]